MHSTKLLFDKLVIRQKLSTKCRSRRNVVRRSVAHRSSQIIGNFKFFSRFIGVDLSLIYEDRFHRFKSTEDVKSKFNPGSDYYLGQILSRSEAMKRNPRN